MRRLDDTPLDPEIEACLDAIDATLAGEPVDPRHAELAELALLLADERPAPRPEFARELDARVARRFAPAPVGGSRSAGAPRGWRWAWGSAAAVVLAGVVAVTVVVGLPHSGGSVSSSSAMTASASGGAGSAAGPLFGLPHAPPSTAKAPHNLSAATPSLPSASSAAVSPQTPANGRKVIHSAEIDLGAAPNQIDAVAQEVFNAVGNAGGIVDQSHVTQTGGLDGMATFSLRIPSQNLPSTLTALSKLRGATVLSRTDASQDVNSRYISATRALADAQALRTALLRQLAAAVTTAQIDSLKSQINDVENAIASDTAAVRALDAQVNYSRVSVQVSAQSGPAPVKHGSGGFTIGKAAHTAGRVLVVAAGVALIALAALVPVALVVALLAWLGAALRRRRREQALDTA